MTRSTMHQLKLMRNKQLRAANSELRLYAKQKIEDEVILLKKYQQQIQELKTETYKLKRMIW